MRDPDFRKKPPPEHWDSPEKSKQRLDAVRRDVAKWKAERAARKAKQNTNVVPFRRPAK